MSTQGLFVFHEAVYFGFSLIYYLISLAPQAAAYKIQSVLECVFFCRQLTTILQKKAVTNDLVINCLKHLMLIHALLELPIVFIFQHFTRLVGIRVSADLPPLTQILFGIVVSVFVEDAYFYWIHRLLHWSVWYRKIHKIHHEYPSPFGVVAEYAHPVEVILLGLGTMLGPLVSINHIFTLYAYLFIRLFQTVEAHCGYEYPWSPNKFIPIWSGARHHDFHHETSSGNYGSFFTIWDRMLNTDRKYRLRLKKI